MNTCLIVKWWWRIFNTPDGTLWRDILKAKYFPSGNPMFASASGGSQFWHDLVRVRDILRSQVKFVVGNGESIRFWTDRWCGDNPLCLSFPVIFSYVSSPEISISDLARSGWDLQLRHALSPEEMTQWQQLAELFPQLSEEADQAVSWPHSASGRFSVKSLYSRLIVGSPRSKFKDVWRAKIPLKIKIFMWQAIRGRLPVADQIRKRNGPGTEFCKLCGAREDTNHVG